MTDRLEAIEIKLAHLERAVAEISDVVARQQKELDRALDRNQRLMEKIAAIESESAAPAPPRTRSHRTTEPRYLAATESTSS
jgi:SlyX protein